MDEYNDVLSSRSLIGVPIVNVRGQKLGQLKELMIDTRKGVVAYAVFSLSHLLKTEKYIAMPWKALTIKDDGGQIVVSTGKDKPSSALRFGLSYQS